MYTNQIEEKPKIRKLSHSHDKTHIYARYQDQVQVIDLGQRLEIKKQNY